MGNTAREEVPLPTNNDNGDKLDQVQAASFGGNYAWPKNLYIEVRDMAAVSFLVYSFGYILDTARKVGGLKGLDMDSDGHMSKQSTTSQLSRSFTPSEVMQIVDDNLTVLQETFPSEFADPTGLKLSLEQLQERATAGEKGGSSSSSRPLTLEEYDDKHQVKEMVYAVTKDEIDKRITLCFRGTDNALAGETNWSTNFNFWKTRVPVPDSIKENVKDVDEMFIHRGFYNYIFGPTADERDSPEKRKFDEILEDVMPLLKANPGYRLYVTGHSLGAALSTLVAFYLATVDDIPQPVTCINFASPRVGDYNFLKVATALQACGKLRLLRVVNDKDSIAAVPIINYYHVGHQIRLYKDPQKDPPEVTYPKLEDSNTNKWGRTWGNSLFASFNLSYDHGDYRERVEVNKEALEKLDLNVLYGDKELTGFTVEAQP